MYTEKFKQLVKLYESMEIEFPHLKTITLAQWAHESARGTSMLARDHNNFGGMMHRREMNNWGLNISSVKYTSPSDNLPAYYASFGGLADWIAAYWKFIDRTPYDGWRQNCETPRQYIEFIKSHGYATDPDYVAKVLKFMPEVVELLSNIKDDTHSEGDNMPKVDIVKNSPNKSARNGTLFRVVLHNTDASFNSALNWLTNPASKVSAHLLIGRDGKVAQLVPFAEKAWHAGPANSQSIGIEIEATNNQRGMTAEQEKVLVEWLKYLMKEYNIKESNIIGHREVMNTSCPGLIWPTTQDLVTWKAKNLRGETPKPDKKVTWYDVFDLGGEVGIAAMAGSEPVELLRAPTALAFSKFLAEHGDHNVKHAPAGKKWPGAVE